MTTPSALQLRQRTLAWTLRLCCGTLANLCKPSKELPPKINFDLTVVRQVLQELEKDLRAELRK